MNEKPPPYNTVNNTYDGMPQPGFNPPPPTQYPPYGGGVPPHTGPGGGVPPPTGPGVGPPPPGYTQPPQPQIIITNQTYDPFRLLRPTTNEEPQKSSSQPLVRHHAPQQTCTALFRSIRTRQHVTAEEDIVTNQELGHIYHYLKPSSGMQYLTPPCGCLAVLLNAQTPLGSIKAMIEVIHTTNFGNTAILGPNSTTLQCPSCHQHITTAVQSIPTTRTHLFAALMCLFGCWPCCLIPYCMDDCQGRNHTCPNCGAYLGTFEN